jgi:hypothetical protein
MAKKLKSPTKKARRRGKKRGPKEERLIITGDPSAILSHLLNKPKPAKS